MEPNPIYIGIKHYEPSQGAWLVAGISKIHKACQKTRPQRSLSMKNPLLLTLKENACNYLMMEDQEERPRMMSDETSFGSLRHSKKRKKTPKTHLFCSDLSSCFSKWCFCSMIHWPWPNLGCHGTLVWPVSCRCSISRINCRKSLILKTRHVQFILENFIILVDIWRFGIIWNSE